MPAAAPKKAAPRVRRPVVIEEIGAEDYANGKGTVKVLVLAQPDAGKTRWSSAFPRPLYLACESTVAASIVTRKIAYEEGLRAPRIVKVYEADSPSNAMLDAIDQLDKYASNKPPGGLPKYQTAILDTADGLQRLLKDEWVESESASMFGGRDAWGFIEAKMSLILQRLMKLDMNVVILCHLKDKEIEVQVGNEQSQKQTIYEPLLQGALKDTILTEFDLIGLMKREIVGGDTEVRGISYKPTNTYPFLKDHFHLESPGDKRLGSKFWPITMDDGTKGGTSDPDTFVQTNYGDLLMALIGDLDDMGSNSIVEEIPESGADAPSATGVVAPAPGGPVPGAAAQPAKATTPAKAPAKAVAAAPGNGAAPVAPSSPPEAPAAAPAAPQSAPQPASPPTPPTAAAEPQQAPAEASTTGTATPPSEPTGEAVDPGPADGAGAGQSTGISVESESLSDPAPETSVATSEAAPAAAEVSAEGSATDVPSHEEAVATVAEQMGGEVVAEGATADAGKVDVDLTGCPICGKDMSQEQPDLVQLSRLKHRTLTLPDGRAFFDTGGCCYEDYQKLNEQKASKTGLYAA